MMGPPGSLARAEGMSSLKASSAMGGRAATATAPAAALRKKFRRVMGMASSLFTGLRKLIAEKDAGGQQNLVLINS